MKAKTIIAVTGKQGSGKSTFCNYLAKELNADLFNLDIYSHKALANDNIKEFLRKKFGDEIFKGDEIDRKALGKIVFEDKEKLSFLNACVYSYMVKEIEKDLENSKDIVILDYALLPKTKFWKTANFKILLEADFNVRMERLEKRDNINKQYLISRDNAGLNYSRQDVDLIIDNTNTTDVNMLVKETCVKIKESMKRQKELYSFK